ncbi:discoidin domain-containing protein, partial [Methanoregula sp.]|uniref:discoidin domain-containing protein n=1 Tax=Methanoregula sp. TaxID=2052170 RepID=UPI000CB3C9B4
TTGPLIVKLDDAEVLRVTGQGSGSPTWYEGSFSCPSGSHTVSFTVEGTNYFTDIDDVSFLGSSTPTPTITPVPSPTPTDQDLTTGRAADTSADGKWTVYVPGHVVDDDPNTYWMSRNAGSNPLPSWWSVELEYPAELNRIRIKSGFYQPKDCRLQGSHDDSTWYDVRSFSVQNNDQWQEFTVSGSGGYRYYRIYVTTSWSQWGDVCIHEVEMYGTWAEPAPTPTPTPTPAPNPDLTTGRSGYASADYSHSIYGPGKAIDDLISTYWMSGNAGSNPLPSWWGVQLESPGIVSTIRMLSSFYRPKDCVLQGSNDNVVLTDLRSFQFQNNDQWQEFPVTGAGSSRYYRINLSSSWNTMYPGVVCIHETG